MKIFVATLIVLTTKLGYNCMAAPWQPSEGHSQIPLWNGTPPNAKETSAPEDLIQSDNLVGGRYWNEITNVSVPTFTFYPPKGHNTNAAVIVFPGGGYRGLAIDLEGTEICDWLTSIGVSCFLLKYRVPGSGPYWDTNLKMHIDPKVHTALQDAQRALSVIRYRAAEWKVDPHKIGVIGFSAGGHLVAEISTHLNRIYPNIDSADNVSVRPDFAIALYPGHMSISYSDLSKLNPAIQVTKETPPTFLVHAQDDPVDPVEYSLLYYAALAKEKVPVEMHIFAEGKHAFGLRTTDKPITKWPDLAFEWLKATQVIGK